MVEAGKAAFTVIMHEAKKQMELLVAKRYGCKHGTVGWQRVKFGTDELRAYQGTTAQLTCIVRAVLVQNLGGVSVRGLADGVLGGPRAGHADGVGAAAAAGGEGLGLLPEEHGACENTKSWTTAPSAAATAWRKPACCGASY